MRFTKIFLLAAVAYLLSGCVEEVTFKVEDPPSNIVVYGRITTDPRLHELSIFQTGGFSKTEGQKPITGAVAVLYDDMGNKEAYTEISEGRYLLEQTTVKGVPGITYELEITLPGGKTIRSRPEKMPQPVPVDNIYGSNNMSQYFSTYVDMTIPAGGDTWIRWEADRIHMIIEINQNIVLGFPFAPPPKVCYLTQPYARQDPNLFHAEQLDSYQVVKQTVGTSLIDNYFYDRNCIQVYQLSTTLASYEYWRDVEKASNPEGTIFDTPPAQIHGNLFYPDDDEVVYGYFEAVAVDTARLFVHRDSLHGIHLPDPCTRDYFQYGGAHYGFLEECLDCLTVPGATVEQPWFW